MEATSVVQRVSRGQIGTQHVSADGNTVRLTAPGTLASKLEGDGLIRLSLSEYCRLAAFSPTADRSVINSHLLEPPLAALLGADVEKVVSLRKDER